MKQRITYIVIILALIATGIVWSQTDWLKSIQPGQTVLAQPEVQPLVSAAGRIEPSSEEIKVGAEINGKLKAVLVAEGDQVKHGQTIAILENRDRKSVV